MKSKQNKCKLAVLGGDRRQAVIAEEFAKSGYDVSVYAINESSRGCMGVEICSSIERAIQNCEFLVLPLPVTRNNIDLNITSNKDIEFKLADVVKLAVENGCEMIFGGMIPEEMKRNCENNSIKVFDFYESESLQSKNALPSAEGALMITMEHTDITVMGMNVLISGFGRIGRRLASLFSLMGAKVSVAARRDEVLCDIALCGYRPIRIDLCSCELHQAVEECDVILNTVPSVIFSEGVIRGITNKPLYVEIASSPGGIDVSAACDAGIRTICAPSLPGKYSPISAGKYIFETISDILSKGGIDE
jgi:dipicolinate synthase subunit A